jgi:hypothetical protein
MTVDPIDDCIFWVCHRNRDGKLIKLRAKTYSHKDPTTANVFECDPQGRTDTLWVSLMGLVIAC